jgi:iron complex outermembrane receptor protein
MNATRAALGVVVALTGLTQPDDCIAQEADTRLEEVVVTARKVAEPYWTVPLTIDVLDRDKLITASIADLAALARMAPGLYFESLWGGTGSAPVLRGQSQPSAAGDNVGVFVGGVYQAERTAIDVAPLDVERIEVVHGPQSTLFGHSTFTGAIHYVPRSPTREFTSGIEVGGGSDDYWAASGFLSGPLPGAALLGRIAAGSRNASGTWTNSADGNSLGDYSRNALAASVVTADGGPWTGELAGRWSRTESAHPAQTSIDGTGFNCGAIEQVSNYWSYFCGPLPVSSPVDLSRGLPDSTNEVTQVSLSIAWSVAATTFESDTSYYKGASDIYRDFDSTSAGETFGVCTVSATCPSAQRPPLPVSRLAQANSVSRQAPETEEWSQEFRLHGMAGHQLDWLVGVTGFLTNEYSPTKFGFERGDLLPNEALTVLLPQTPQLAGPVARGNRALVDDPNREQVVQSKTEVERRTLAVFGALSYRPTDRVGLRAELRTTWERLELNSVVANFAPSFGTAVPAQDFTDTTPRFSIDLTPDVGSLLYVSAARGSRSGGINAVPGLLPQEQTFDPEYNWTYELSGRYREPQQRWTGSMTLYHIDWRDTQITGFSNTPGIANLITRNTAGVTTNGVEMTFEAQLHPLLTVQGAYSYTNPEFDSGSDDPGSSLFCGLKGNNLTSSFCTVGPPRSGAAPPGTYVPYVDGNMPQRAPRTQWQVGLNGTSPAFADGWRAVGAVDLSYQSDVYDRPINGARFGERTLLSARAALVRGPWTLELWGTNLTDDEYIRAVSSRGAVFYPVSPRPLDLVYGEGRRIGLTLRYGN